MFAEIIVRPRCTYLPSDSQGVSEVGICHCMSATPVFCRKTLVYNKTVHDTVTSKMLFEHLTQQNCSR